MRDGVGALGLIAAMFVIWTHGSYGFMTSDNQTAGIAAAGLMGALAFAALAGPILAALVWRRNVALSLMLWLVALAAFPLSVSQSLNVLAVRGDKADAQRKDRIEQGRLAKIEVERLDRDLAALTFAHTTSAMLTAAKAAVDGADDAVKQECGRVGDNCRRRQDAKSAALIALAKATADLALTEQAASLDARIATLRPVAAMAGAVANPAGEALARIVSLFRSDVTAAGVATWQQLLIVSIVELLIAALLLTYDTIRPAADDHSRTSVAPRAESQHGPQEWREKAVPVEGGASRPTAVYGAPRPGNPHYEGGVAHQGRSQAIEAGRGRAGTSVDRCSRAAVECGSRRGGPRGCSQSRQRRPGDRRPLSRLPPALPLGRLRGPRSKKFRRCSRGADPQARHRHPDDRQRRLPQGREAQGGLITPGSSVVLRFCCRHIIFHHPVKTNKMPATAPPVL